MVMRRQPEEVNRFVAIAASTEGAFWNMPCLEHPGDAGRVAEQVVQ